MARIPASRALIVLASLPLAACVADSEARSGEDEPAPVVRPDGPIDENTAVLRAKAAVVDRTGARAQDVAVDAVEHREWPDSSMGCAKPGQAYLQVITPGHQVRLSWAGQRFDMRVAEDGRVVMCSGPGVRSLRGTPMAFDKATLGQAQAAARADLAVNLGIAEDDIEFLGVRRRSFPDNTLGCPGSVDTVIPGPVSAYVFTMRARGKPYTYHSDLERTFACPAFSVD
jgi:hypothetical protein